MDDRLPSLVGVLLLGGSAGCTSLGTGAAQQFSAESSCPLDRVTVAVQRGRPVSPPPVPEPIRGDPARLAEWQRQQDKIRRAVADNTYFLVRGCGLERTYFCVHVAEGSTPSCTAVSPGVVLTLGFPGWPDAI